MRDVGKQGVRSTDDNVGKHGCTIRGVTWGEGGALFVYLWKVQGHDRSTAVSQAVQQGASERGKTTPTITTTAARVEEDMPCNIEAAISSSDVARKGFVVV